MDEVKITVDEDESPKEIIIIAKGHEDKGIGEDPGPEFRFVVDNPKEFVMTTFLGPDYC